MYINVDEKKKKIVEKFINEHPNLFKLKNKKSGSTAWGKYLGDIDRNNILVIFDAEPSKQFTFCFNSKNDIIEIYDVSTGEIRIYGI